MSRFRSAERAPDSAGEVLPAPLRIARAVRWTVFGMALALAALFVAWRALAAVDFGYPFLYDALSIDATIERYGPRNEARPGFQQTDRAERERLFGAIVAAVRADGRDLEGITYHAPDGRPIGRLLTASEIQHLEDVAALIAGFERLGALSLLIAAGLVLASALRHESMPGLRWFALGTGGVLVTGALLVFALGPVTVFYWLHEQIFPPDHPWFFWYEESLMSTLMQAPTLFGAITALWLPLATALAIAAWYTASRVLNRRSENAGTTNEHE